MRTVTALGQRQHSGWSWDDEYNARLRRIKSMKLFDVSIATYGAYAEPSVYVLPPKRADIAEAERKIDALRYRRKLGESGLRDLFHGVCSPW